MSRQLVMSTSLDPDSRSRLLLRHMAETLRADGEDVEFVDLAELHLSFAGAPGWADSPAGQEIAAAVGRAEGVVLGLGIYNYGPSAAAKAALEFGGRAWTAKVVTLACAAGGRASYMAALPLVHGLMLDFRCIVVPRFVYATAEAFDGDRISDIDVERRLVDAAREHRRVTAALALA